MDCILKLDYDVPVQGVEEEKEYFRINLVTREVEKERDVNMAASAAVCSKTGDWNRDGIYESVREW